MNRSLTLFLSLMSFLIGLASFTGCSESVAAPSAYQRWNAKDGTFSIDYPDGWKAEGGGKQGVQWAEFTKGSCKVKVDVNVTASLLGDIAESGSTAFTGGDALAEVPEELAPAAIAHEANPPGIPAEFKAYKEEAAIKITPSLGEGRKSPFSASTGFGQKIKGYRATILSNDKGIHIYCYCPAKDWEKFQPAYDKILDSVGYGE